MSSAGRRWPLRAREFFNVERMVLGWPGDAEVLSGFMTKCTPELVCIF